MQFQIIGRVGNIKEIGRSFAPPSLNYPRKDDAGNWTERTHWNQVSVSSPQSEEYGGKRFGAVTWCSPAAG